MIVTAGTSPSAAPDRTRMTGFASDLVIGAARGGELGRQDAIRLAARRKSAIAMWRLGSTIRQHLGLRW